VKTRLLVVIAVTLLAAVPTAALSDSSRRAANSTTFADSVGEDANAPDITSVVVSNDDAGNITFQINVSNRPALTEDMFFLIDLDTDQSTATGGPDVLLDTQGNDYVIQLVPGSADLFQWNGSDYVAASSQSSLTFSYPAGGPTIRVSASDLGKTKGLKFAVLAVSGFAFDANGEPNFTNVHADAVPDFRHGVHIYQVLTRLILGVTSYTTAPKPAKAGRSFSASLAATENDTGGPVAAGTVSCVATIAFKRIPAVTHVLTNGVANCVWRIPATAKGKALRGTITLNVKGVKVSRSFSTRIS
jgi:hypothetical protein